MLDALLEEKDVWDSENRDIARQILISSVEDIKKELHIFISQDEVNLNGRTLGKYADLFDTESLISACSPSEFSGWLGVAESLREDNSYTQKRANYLLGSMIAAKAFNSSGKSALFPKWYELVQIIRNGIFIINSAFFYRQVLETEPRAAEYLLSIASSLVNYYAPIDGNQELTNAQAASFLIFGFSGIPPEFISKDKGQSLLKQLEATEELVPTSRRYINNFFTDTLDMVDAGFDMKKLSHLWPKLSPNMKYEHNYLFGLNETFVPFKFTKDIVNSDLSEDKKLHYLHLFQFIKGIPDLPAFTVEGNWEAQVFSHVKEIFKNIYQKESSLSLEDTVRLASLKFSSVYDEKQAIVDILAGEAKKSFKTDKIYKTVEGIGTLRAEVGFQENVELLVYALLGSKDPVNITRADDFFKDYSTSVEYARKTMPISKNKFYNNNSELINKAVHGDYFSAAKLFDIFCGLWKSDDNEKLHDLISLVESKKKDSVSYDYLIYKSQSGNYKDLFNNRTTMACTFHPGGLYKQAAALYTLDPDIALIKLIPKTNGIESDPLGVAITFFAKDNQDRRYLVVDSVEGGNLLLNSWKQDFYEVIMEFSKDTDCDYVFLNKKGISLKARNFIEHVESLDVAFERIDSLHLEKNTGTETIQKYGMNKLYLDTFGGWKIPGGNAQGLLIKNDNN